jgi:hypothetical protein
MKNIASLSPNSLLQSGLEILTIPIGTIRHSGRVRNPFKLRSFQALNPTRACPTIRELLA